MTGLQDSREQLAIAEFARALLVIPRTLAVNAAKDATDLVAKLRAFHNTSQIDPAQANLKWFVQCAPLLVTVFGSLEFDCFNFIFDSQDWAGSGGRHGP